MIYYSPILLPILLCQCLVPYLTNKFKNLMYSSRVRTLATVQQSHSRDNFINQKI